MQTSTTVVTSLKRQSQDADMLMVALEQRIQSLAHRSCVLEEASVFNKSVAKKRIGGFRSDRVKDDDDDAENGARSDRSDLRDAGEEGEEEEGEGGGTKTRTNSNSSNNSNNNKRKKSSAQVADEAFRLGLKYLRANESKKALDEFERALEHCPRNAREAKRTLENARARAMELVYSGSIDDADGKDGVDEEAFDDDDVNKRENEEDKADDDDDVENNAAADMDYATNKASSSTEQRRQQDFEEEKMKIEELYDASRWLLRSTPRDAREALRLLKTAESLIENSAVANDSNSINSNSNSNEYRIAKEKIERAIRFVIKH